MSAKHTLFSIAFLSASLTVSAQTQDSIQYGGFSKYRIGSYGEITASMRNYSDKWSTSTGGSLMRGSNKIAIPRLVIAGDYKFSKNWILGTEVEFEAGGTGAALELEWDNENGEYERELEKGGEVAIEQFHITRLIIPELNVRAGHLILPVGQINGHHEPLEFFGTIRPESETALIPSTWHETGLELFGSFLGGLIDYQAIISAGLNCDGFRLSDWVKKGKQGLFEEDSFNSPAYTLRLDFKPVQGLRFSGSLYYCADASDNADKTWIYPGFKVPVAIYTFDAQYKGAGWTARAQFMSGNIGNSADLAYWRANKLNSAVTGYTTKNTAAKQALSYGWEAGYDLSHAIPVLRTKNCYGLTPFVRYEYYNSNYKMQTGTVGYDYNEVSKWTLGINYKPLPFLAIKADYSTRQRGTAAWFKKGKYNGENAFNLAVAYNIWFAKK